MVIARPNPWERRPHTAGVATNAEDSLPTVKCVCVGLRGGYICPGEPASVRLRADIGGLDGSSDMLKRDEQCRSRATL